jgi:hypothetical protein
VPHPGGQITAVRQQGPGRPIHALLAADSFAPGC